MPSVAFDSLDDPQVETGTRLQLAANLADSVDTVYVSILLVVCAILLWRAIHRTQRIHV